MSRVQNLYVDDEPSIEDEPELVDLTQSLTLHSKRTERRRKKQQRRTKPPSTARINDLPYEILVEILCLLRPSDLFRLSRTSQLLRAFILDERETLANRIIRLRYPCLQRCFYLPELLETVDPALHPMLQSDERQEILAIHKKPYQHVRGPDPTLVCTCLSCMLRWNAMCLIIDFAHWQPNLDRGEPIPMIPRGRSPEWNQKLVAQHAGIVDKALRDPLWYASILEAHLDSTTRSIRRHTRNKGNKRPRFRMTEEDAQSGADAFLERSGPPSLDFPYHRDNYYMLEAYLPNRGWSRVRERWMYVPADQHQTDVQFLVRAMDRRRAQAEAAAAAAAAALANAQKDIKE